MWNREKVVKQVRKKERPEDGKRPIVKEQGVTHDPSLGNRPGGGTGRRNKSVGC